MMLYLFDQVLQFHKEAESVIDDNLKTDYGRLRMLIRNDRNREQLKAIVQENGIFSDVIARFPLDGLQENKHFVSLLFYLGLLTVDKVEEGALRLKIPNYSIRTVYWEYIEQMTLDGNADVMIDLNEQKAALRELAYRGNPAPFIAYVSQNIFSRLSNRDLQDFDEKYIRIMLLNGLFQSKLYVTLTELEVTKGYADIYMRRSHLLPDIPYEWVWEIKYVKKADVAGRKKNVLQAKREEAREQLKKYRDSSLFAGRTDVRYLSVIFIGKDRYEMEEL
jgi:hypothetical protein